jgi:hypothetical protein
MNNLKIKDFYSMPSFSQYYPRVFLMFEPFLEVARITHIYWPIECTPKPSFKSLLEVVRITHI